MDSGQKQKKRFSHLFRRRSSRDGRKPGIPTGRPARQSPPPTADAKHCSDSFDPRQLDGLGNKTPAHLSDETNAREKYSLEDGQTREASSAMTSPPTSAEWPLAQASDTSLARDMSAEVQSLNLDKATAEDVYIAIMGITGSGKSTFINHLVEPQVIIGHGLDSCTSEVDHFHYQYNDKTTIHLIDTPGFDDSLKTDYQVLTEVAAFLKKSYERGILLNGLIYLHNVSDQRFKVSDRKSLQMFKRIVGGESYTNVILATTRWEIVDVKEGEAQEAQLIRTDEFWGQMKEMGCQIRRHMNTKDSARSLVSFFVANNRSKVTLKIQRDLVDRRKGLIDTAAGQTSKGEMAAYVESESKKLRELKETFAEAMKKRDESITNATIRLQEEKTQELKELETNYKNLREDLERHLEERSRRQEKRIEELLKASRRPQQERAAQMERAERTKPGRQPPRQLLAPAAVARTPQNQISPKRNYTQVDDMPKTLRSASGGQSRDGNTARTVKDADPHKLPSSERKGVFHADTRGEGFGEASVSRSGQTKSGADPPKPPRVARTAAADGDGVSNAGFEEATSSRTELNWLGASLPRGYMDVTDQVNIRGLDLLNADPAARTARSLFDKDRPRALNKNDKYKDKRGDDGPIDWVESYTDEQLMLFIPFQSTLKVHTLHITSLPPLGYHEAPIRPKTLRIYSNTTDCLGFVEAEGTPPQQEVILGPADWSAATGTAKIELRFVKFQNVTSLVIFVVDGDGDGSETIRVDRVRIVGKRGERQEMGRLKKVEKDQKEHVST